MGDLNEKTIKEIVALALQTGGPRQVDGGSTQYAVIPEGSKIVDLSQYKYNSFAAHPQRVKATVNTLDAASFIDYWQRFSDENSRLFADETSVSVTGILDYHGQGGGGPRWCEHKLKLTLRHSPEWTVWMGANGQANKMSQSDFGEFVEDNTPDFINPNAATMMELARSLEAKSDVEFQSGVRMNNGQVQITFNEQVKGVYGSGKVDIPESFEIAIPVFVGGERKKLTARLRYRINGGKLVIWYDLLRAKQLARDEFVEQVKTISTTLNVAAINGGMA